MLLLLNVFDANEHGTIFQKDDGLWLKKTPFLVTVGLTFEGGELKVFISCKQSRLIQGASLRLLKTMKDYAHKDSKTFHI